MRDAILLCLLAAIPAGITGWVYHRRPKPAVNPEDQATLERVAKWGDRVIWLDARSQKKYEKDHVPGALPLNEDHWDELLLAVVEAWSPEKIIVVYCSEEDCDAAADVVRRLKKEMEWTDVYMLQGGWQTWKQAHPGS